jgi:hypothetical protein
VTRRTASLWLIGLYACLLNLVASCPTHGQEIGRFDARGEVVVTRSGDVLRVAIPTEYGRITVEVGVTLGPDAPPPDVPGAPVPPEPEPEPDPPSTWSGMADHTLRTVPSEDRAQVAAAIVAGLDAVISPPVGSAPITGGQSAAALLLDTATSYPFSDPPPKTPTTLLAIVRVGDVLIKSGEDAPLAVRYAQALRPRFQEIANGG